MLFWVPTISLLIVPCDNNLFAHWPLDSPAVKTMVHSLWVQGRALQGWRGGNAALTLAALNPHAAEEDRLHRQPSIKMFVFFQGHRGIKYHAESWRLGWSKPSILLMRGQCLGNGMRPLCRRRYERSFKIFWRLAAGKFLDVRKKYC